MSRKFKFRVWFKPEQRFLDPWTEEDPIFSLREMSVAIYDRKKDDWEYVNDDDVVIQQSTGLLDKNGREIFEGDLILGYDEISEVKWYEAYSGYQFCLVSKDGILDFYGGIPYPENKTIVGHIYDGVSGWNNE